MSIRVEQYTVLSGYEAPNRQLKVKVQKASLSIPGPCSVCRCAVVFGVACHPGPSVLVPGSAQTAFTTAMRRQLALHCSQQPFESRYLLPLLPLDLYPLCQFL